MSIKHILKDFKKGNISAKDAEKELRIFSIETVSGVANLDTHREMRSGVPEVVLGESKTAFEVTKIANELVKKKGRCIVSRISNEKVEQIRRDLHRNFVFELNERAAVLIIKAAGYEVKETGGKIGILCAGTSDMARAEEARIISEEMGVKVHAFYDVGIAGIHRVFPALKDVVEHDLDALVVAAGMEGALPSVVAGLVDIPVIGLPVSTGYGMGGKGKTALLSMLQSCSPGIAVVNIDNGLGAGVMASLIANRAAERTSRNSSEVNAGKKSRGGRED